MSRDHAERAGVRSYLAAAGFVALATVAGALARGHLADPDFVMLYLLAVAVAATRFGRGPALLSSALSVLAYDFFFVAPSYTFAVANERHLLTFATLFVVGFLISALSDAAKAAALKARTEELRSSLLSSVSHDLRTPLAAITGAASALKEEGSTLDPAQRAELLEAISEEAARLERLVRNLLDMSRLESGTLEPHREWVPLEEVIGAALTRAEAMLGARPVRTTLAPELPLLWVDPVLLEQLFFNLLENVAKYTPADSAVEIVARRAEATVEIEVIDHGPGLPEGSGARLFEKFYRGARTGVQGAGLGLAICRGVALAHGGTISAAPNPAGGAIFRVSLPISGEAPPVPSEPDGEAKEVPT